MPRQVVAFSQPLTSDRFEKPDADKEVTFRVMANLPVIILDPDTGLRRVVPMRWGFPHPKDWRRPQPIHARAEAIKSGLERDGLGDLVLSVSQADADSDGKAARKISRRKEFSSKEIYLPKVLHVEGDVARDLDYETDVLAAIDWRGFDPKEIALSIPENARAAESQLQRISLTDTPEHFEAYAVAAGAEELDFDTAYAVRMISDLVPNPFVGREIVGRLLAGLKARGFDGSKIGALSGLLIETLRRGLDKERSTRAEKFFKDAVEAGRIQFRLRLDGKNWRMPFFVETTQPEKARKLAGKSGGPLEKSLFAPIYENDLNNDEQDVAVYLDGEAALTWWHRNVARTQYGLQGWRKPKIYPDFIFAVQRKKGEARITVLETKGDQLDNLDTAYKRNLLYFLSENFAWSKTLPAGSLELLKDNGETVECSLVLMSEWKVKLPELLN